MHIRSLQVDVYISRAPLTPAHYTRHHNDMTRIIIPVAQLGDRAERPAERPAATNTGTRRNSYFMRRALGLCRYGRPTTDDGRKERRNEGTWTHKHKHSGKNRTARTRNVNRRTQLAQNGHTNKNARVCSYFISMLTAVKSVR